MPNTRRERRAKAGSSDAVVKRRSAAERLRDFYLDYRWAIIGGLCGALAFEPMNWLPLTPLAPLLAFIALREAPTPGAGFRRMLVFGWIFYFGALHWLTTIGNYAPVPILASFGIALLALYTAMYPALATWAVRRWAWPLGPGAQFVIFSSAWLIAEWLRTLGRLAMPLAQLGHTWAIWPLAIQPAQFLGELGITLEILWLAGLMFYWGYYFFIRRTRRTSETERTASHVLPSIGRGIIPTMAFVVLCFASGLLLSGWSARLETFAKKPEAQSLRVALVQPNIDQRVKLASYAYPYDENDERSMQNARVVMTLLREAIAVIIESMVAGQPRPEWDALMARVASYPPEGRDYAMAFHELQQRIADEGARVAALTSGTLDVDLIVMPETAFVEYDFTKNPVVQKRVERMARRVDAPILLGAGREVEVVGEEYPEMYNSAYLVEPDGRVAPVAYDKMRLVPFGEALPYVKMIPGLQKVTGIGEFTEGKNYTLFNVKGKSNADDQTTRPLRLGTLICFESTFSAAARRFVKEGADILTVITNDGWYGMSAGAPMHHHLSLLRAVENRRYLLRCANTGISSIISPTGEMIATLPLGEAGVLDGMIVPKTDYGMTMFSRRGNSWLCLPFLLIICSMWRNRKIKAAAN